MASTVLSSPQATLDLCDNSGRTALMIAVRLCDSYALHPNFGHSRQHGYISVIQVLLDKPGLLNAQDTDGRSALMLAIHYSPGAAHVLLSSPDIDVHLTDKNGQSALGHASYHGSYDIVKILVTRPGVDLNIQKKETGRNRSHVSVFLQATRHCQHSGGPTRNQRECARYRW